MTPSLPSEVEELRQISPFDLLSVEEVAELVAQGKRTKFQPGQALVRRNEPVTLVFVVLEGRVRHLANRRADGSPFTLEMGERGNLPGWSALLSSISHETVIASQPTVALGIPAAAFQSVMERAPEFRSRLIGSASRSEIYDVLFEHLNLEHAEKTLEPRERMEEAVARVKVRQGQLPEAEEGMMWLVSDGGEPLERGAVWPPGQSPIDLKTVRLLGFPESVVHPSGTRAAAVLTEASGSTESEPHRTTFPEIRAEAGPAAIGACFEMLAQFFRRPARMETLRRIVESKTAPRIGDLFALGSLAEVSGFHAQLIRVKRDKLAAIEAPALLFWKGEPAVLFASSGEECVISSPLDGLIHLPRSQWSEFPEELEVLLIRVSDTVEREKFSFRWFLPAVVKYKRVLIEVFVASFFVQLFALANPIITQVIVDKVLVQNSLQTLNVLGLLLVIVAISGAVTTALRTYLFVDTTNRIDLALGTKVIDHLYRLTLGYFHRRPVGEVTSRVNELENIRQFLTGTALTVVLDGLFSVIYIAIMLFYNVSLTIVALSALPLLGLMTFIVAPIFREQLRRRAIHNAAAQSYLVETLTGIQTVKAQNLEQRSRWEWQERYAKFISEGFRTTVTTTTVNSVTGLLGKFSDLGVLWLGAYLVIEGKLTLGQLIAFRIIAGYVTNPLLRLIQSWQNFQEVGLSIERLGDVMSSPVEQTEEEGKNIPMPEIAGAVRYEQITFGYTKGAAPQLRNVSFEIPQGAFVGVVGQSGSGKSTLMKLLPRLYRPDEGRVLVDGYDVSKVEMISLRRQVATVLQDSLLFDVSVRENIAVGDPSATSEQIIEAAKVGAAHDFIMSLPDGYNTRCGEQGRALSGGQRQRIAIARALLQNPRLLIFDEATSALDYPTERVVCANLARAFEKRTVFFVTHRLRSVERADQILVMENGILAESGRHAELIARRGVYYSLYQQQGAE